MNALLTTTLLTLPSAFAANELASTSDAPATTSYGVTQAAQKATHLSDIFSAINENKSLPFIIKNFSQLMPELFDASGNLTSIATEFSSIVDSLNIPQLIPTSRFTEEALAANPDLRALLLASADASDNDIPYFIAAGDKAALHLVVAGYAEGKYGLPQNPDKLLELANNGRSYAKFIVTKGYAEGKYGLPQSPDKLLELANNGWGEAQSLVAEGYAEGKYGLPQSPDKLLELVNNGWENVQRLVAQGYAEGKYGLPQNPDKLLELAKQGWAEAQSRVAKGYAYGQYGLPKNPAELLKLAKHGWAVAQHLVVQGYAEEKYGLPKNPVIAELLKQSFKKLNDDLKNAPLATSEAASTAE